LPGIFKDTEYPERSYLSVIMHGHKIKPVQLSDWRTYGKTENFGRTVRILSLCNGPDAHIRKMGSADPALSGRRSHPFQ
jgi:hypothetical protein